MIWGKKTTTLPIKNKNDSTYLSYICHYQYQYLVNSLIVFVCSPFTFSIIAISPCCSYLFVFYRNIQNLNQKVSMSKVLSAIGRKLVIDCFALQALVIQAGATIQKLQHGEVHIKLPKHPLLLQHHNNFHGGVISYLGDICGGLSCISVMTDPSHSSVTVELKANFLKPAVGNFLIGKGKVINEGGSLLVATAEIYTQENVLAAFTVQTNKRLVPRHKTHHK